MRKFFLFVVCLLLTPAVFVSAQTDPYLDNYREKAAKNPPDVAFTIGFKNGQTRFRMGEIIPLELRFSTLTDNRYDFLKRTYDRSGRLQLDGFVIDREERTYDPLSDYFYRGGWMMGGGLFSVPTLGASFQIIDYELNDYVAFKEPGKYRVYIVSPRVSLKKDKKDGLAGAMFGRGIPLVSNVLEFEILPADEKWQAEKLAEGIGRDCRILRYLGTKAAAKEMLVRFARGDKSCEFDNYIGLFGSPERGFIVGEMERMLAASEFAVTTEFFEVLVRLRYYLDNPKPENGDTDFPEFLSKKAEKKKNSIRLDYLEKLSKALPVKSKPAFQTSLETYFSFHADGEKPPPPEMVAALIDVFDGLWDRKKSAILRNSLDKLKVPAMLPILRKIYDKLEKTDPAAPDSFYDRELLNQSIAGIYGLDREAGKRIVLDEMRRPKQKVYTAVLELLPKSESAEAETILLEKLNAGNIPADDLSSVFSLIGYYETPKLIAKLRETYAARIETVDCGAQLEFLKIFFRADPGFGEETLGKIVKTDSGKGCLGANLAGAIEPRWSPEIERIVAGLLEDDKPFVFGNAAEMLGKYGSAGVRDRIWKRLERFNREERAKPDFAAGRNDTENWQVSSAEWRLAAALSESPNWWFDRESKERLARLCLYNGCREQVEKLNKIFGAPVKIEASFDDDDRLTFAAGQYKKMSLDALRKKLAQFPPETTFVWVSNDRNPDDAKNFREIKEFVESRQMKLTAND